MPSHSSTSNTTAGRRASTRAGTNARNEIIAMLKEDHKRVKKAFRDFERLDTQEDEQECETLVRTTCAELEVHAALEEELFYPAARECLHEEDLIDEAEVEHMTAKVLIARLKEMSPDDEKFAATFKVLGEYIKHHVREEETEMFQQLGRAKFDWAQLLEEMTARREALMQECMPQSGGRATGTGAKGGNGSEEEDEA